MSTREEILARVISSVTFLKQIDLFRDVPADYLAAVAAVAEERTCYAGELLFEEGDPGDCLYLIQEGAFRVVAQGAEVARLGAGDVIGEMAVLDSNPRSASATALEDGRLLRIPSQEFRLLLSSHPEMAMALLRTLSRRLRGAPASAGPAPASEPEEAAREVSASTSPVDLPAGSVLAGRFRIVELLDGARFTADDLELGEPIEIHLAPKEITANDALFERLRKRLAAARRLSHRNVQRAFDLLRHDDLGLITLERAEGPTLEERIRQAGKLPADEAWTVARQLASALAAFEAAGLSPGSLSASNVVLIPESKSIEGARQWRPMIPSIDPHESPDDAADLAAFGRLLHEMTTGERTGGGEDEKIDPRLEPIVQRLSEGDPARRFANFAELASAFEGRERFSPARQMVSVGLLAAAALAVGLLFGPALRLLHPKTPAGAPSAASSMTPARKAIAVLGLTNGTGDAKRAWIATALGEMLGSELAAGGRVRLVPSDDVARARAELGVTDVEKAGAASIEALGKRLGSDYWVTGAYSATPGGLSLTLRLVEASSGKIIATAADEAPETALLELATRLGTRLRYELRLGDVGKRDALSVRAALPENPRAAELYAEGLDRLRRFEAAEARERLEKAVAEDPTHALAQAALARAYDALGYDEKAREAAHRAHDLSLDLSRDAQLAIEARYRESIGERGRAIELYEKLHAATPDDPEPMLALASLQSADGRAKDALATVENLRRTRAGSVDARTDLAEAEAAGALGDFRRELAAAVKAADGGRAQSAFQVVGRARLTQARALRRLKDTLQARAAAEEARVLFDRAGDKGGAAHALVELASIATDNKDSGEAGRMLRQALDISRELEDQRGIVESLVELSWTLRSGGDQAASRKAAEQAYRIAQEIGDRRLEVRSGNALANAFRTVGDNTTALRIYRANLVLARQTGDKGALTTLLHNVALIEQDQGDPDAAKSYEEAIALDRASGDLRSLPATLMNLSIVELAHGRREHARALDEEAEQICRKTGNDRTLSYAVTGLAYVDLQEGKLASARARLEEARELHRRLGETSLVSLTETYLAWVGVEEGHLAESAATGRASAAIFQKDGRPLEESFSRLVAARALVALGDMKGAAVEVERVAQIEVGLQVEMGLTRKILAERIRGASGAPADLRAALVDLDALAPRAAATDVGLGFEARVAATELERDPSARRARIAGIAKDAHAAGYGRFVRRAQALSEAPAP